MPSPAQSLTGQLVWLITGTSSGLGLRLVASALARGDCVIATARSASRLPSFDKAQKIYEKPFSSNDSASSKNGTAPLNDIPNEYASNLFTLQLDITAGEACLREKVAEAASHWGRIDVLVNNAGLSYPGIIEEGGSPMFRSVFETNFFSTVDMTTASLPYIRASKGWVVNVGSRSVWKAGIAGIAPYFASKAALHSYTTTLATELKEFGVKVLLVAPGAMRTEGMYGGSWFGSDSQKESLPSHTRNGASKRSAAPSKATSPLPLQSLGTSPQFLEEYDDIRTRAQKRYTSIGGTEPGDPAKAMELLVDYIRREGAWGLPDEAQTGNASSHLSPTPYHPPTLILGSQSLADARTYCEELLGITEALSDHGCGEELNFD